MIIKPSDTFMHVMGYVKDGLTSSRTYYRPSERG